VDFRLRVAAAAVIAVALGFAVVKLPATIRRLESRSDANAALTRSQRLIAAAYALDFSRDFVEEAAALLPRDAYYVVETGPNAGNTSGVALNGVPPFLENWLLPRRLDRRDPHDAGWLLCYGCDLSQFPEARVVWRADPGLAIARLGT
jgi:hypothetical protein